MARTYQIPLLAIDRLIKLGEVERILESVFHPTPSRHTIVGWIEDGTLEGRQIGVGNNWFVYESSLDNLIRASQESRQLRFAA